MSETPQDDPRPIQDVLKDLPEIIDTPGDEVRRQAAEDATLRHDVSELTDKRRDAEAMLDRGEADAGVESVLRELEEPLSDAQRDGQRLTDDIEEDK